ncbi:hypothetical protein [Lysobacter enzymogenes]|uniref:hypothetical protein n=1 Tax=Lysobacter enzymogenes TaxID=69 RepID=UPI00099D42B3|nr:hypothetical protein [Lysobacter enzymogenes]UZW62736.1 hypothetical protein BV903_010775 [Lysobacter enzymogenes]
MDHLSSTDAATRRLMICASSRDHAYAEAHRKAGLRPLTRRSRPRVDRLRLIALKAEARAHDNALEAR